MFFFFFYMGRTAWLSTVTLLTVGESLSRKPSCIRMVPKTNTHVMYPPLFCVSPTNNNKNKSKWRHNKSPSKTVTRIDFILLFASVIWRTLLISMYFTPPVVRLECNKTTNRHKWLLWNPADLPLMLHRYTQNEFELQWPCVVAFFYFNASSTKCTKSGISE